ncbi:MAG: hypothetical protein ACK4WD_02190 [Flavobacteriales bacterium]|jgi:hypothetical protein
MRLLLVLMSILVIVSCRKDDTTWNTDVSVPLFRGELQLNDIIADSLLMTDENGLWSLIYKGNISDLNFDSLAQIPDTTVSESFKVPFNSGSITLPAGASIINVTRDIEFDIPNGVQLKRVRMKSGTLQYRVVNYINGYMTSVFSLPGLLNEGVPLLINAATPPAQSDIPGVAQGSYDLENFEFDLRGSAGSSFNEVFVEATVSVAADAPTSAVVQGQDSVVVELSFIDAVVEYATGYFGQHTYVINEDEPLFEGVNLPEGSLALERASLTLDIVNNVGVDARLNLNSVASVSGANSIDLTYAPFNQPILLTRALDNGWGVYPTSYSYSANESNSNLPQWIGNLPQQLSLQGELTLNPLGNISGSNDFIYTENPIELDYEVQVPLRFATESIILSDTLDISAEIEEDFYGSLELLVDNQYPFSIFVDLILLNTVTDEEFILGLNQQVRAGIQTPNSSEVSAVGSILSFPVNEVIFEKLKENHRMIVRGKITTPNYPEMVGLYDHYKMIYSAVLRGQYGVVIK